MYYLENYENLGAELKQLREKEGITLKELCEEIGYEVSPYNLFENGKRPIKKEALAEYMYYKVQTAVHKLKTDEERNYYTVNATKHEQALECISKGYNVVKTAVKIGVDEDTLRRHLLKNEIKFEEFSDTRLFR